MGGISPHPMKEPSSFAPDRFSRIRLRAGFFLGGSLSQRQAARLWLEDVVTAQHSGGSYSVALTADPDWKSAWHSTRREPQ